MEIKYVGYGEWILIDRTGSYGAKAKFYPSKKAAITALKQEAALKNWIKENPIRKNK